MSAAEEDTELRDLLIHTLENNGVLNKIKAELRASVFLALEEQERAENKPSLINESLRQFLATRDGRLVAGLLTDFLQHFHLDFTLAVLQPEACLPSAPDDRTSTCRELGLPVPQAPLLLELVRHCQQRDVARPVPQELPPQDMAEAQARFRQENAREVGGEALRALFAGLCPHFSRSMLDRYVTDELAGRAGMDEHSFLATYRRLFLQCRSVVTRDLPPGTQLHGEHSQTDSAPRGDPRQEEDDLEGDSFFDDPIPKPEKAYGWKEKTNGAAHSQSSLSGSRKVSDGSGKELRSANEEDYMDDFHSSSQRSELSIGEDLEEELSVDDLTTSDHKLEELTLDNSLSHLSDVADYLEDVS